MTMTHMIYIETIRLQFPNMMMRKTFLMMTEKIIMGEEFVRDLYCVPYLKKMENLPHLLAL